MQGVARRALELRRTVPIEDSDLLVAAAWLHDIGYGPDLVRTGMHAIDGALHLQDTGYPARLVALVAHHTGARFEADERGLAGELSGFIREESPTADALTTADLTTGPDGEPIGVHARIDEILGRYPATTAVHRAVTRARPVLVGAVERTLHRYRIAPPSTVSSLAGRG